MEFSIKDLFTKCDQARVTFTEEILNGKRLFLCSVDIVFTNVWLDETIEIWFNELLKSSQTVPGLNKQQVLGMLLLTTKEKVILFDQKYFSQIDGVAMGSPLLVNIS